MSEHPILNNLNPQQEEAVLSNDSHLLVVAGAGSGKTRVLTRKIAYLIQNNLAYPSQVLAMTFSNKAANEMKHRIAGLLGQNAIPYSIGTFHAMCLRILREHAAHIDLSPNFSIYDTSDQLAAIKQCLKKLNIDPKVLSPKFIAHSIDQARNESIHIVPYIQNNFAMGEEILDCVIAYEQLLKDNHALDFGSLLSKTLLLLQDHENVKEQLQSRWTRILIDEYQDTNLIQKKLIQHLCGPNNIVCAVGDEDQSIYAWRGARVENMLQFPEDFPGAQIVKLEQNYRSTQAILNAANNVVGNNIGRRKKSLWTDQGLGHLIEHYHADSDYEEAMFVLNKVEQLIDDEQVPANEISVFYRTHVQSRLLEEECRRRNIHYTVLGGIKFYDRREIKDVLCYLRLLLNKEDDIAFLRVINSPTRGIGKTTLAQLVESAQFTNSCLYDAIPVLQGSRKAHKALREFHFWFEALRIECESMDMLNVVETVLQNSGYTEALQQDPSVEAQARLDNIDELLRSMQEFVQHHERNDPELPALSTYLSQISLVSDLDKHDQNSGITLMTIHNSKGLEFDAVFVVGLEEGVFPHKRALEDNDQDEIEEERRLCYVAMTRARKHLFLSSCSRRHLYKNLQHNPVARFIQEIPKQYMVAHPDSKMNNMRAKPAFGDYSFAYDTDVPKTRTSSFQPLPSSSSYSSQSYSHPYKVGTQIMHPKFGQGTIKTIEGNDSNLKLSIHFPNLGVKKILPKYCNLDII